MKHIPAIKSVLSVVLLATPPAFAQSSSPDAGSSLKLDLPKAESANRFGLNYRMGFNAPVSFKNLGGFPALSVPRYTPDGDRYNYDNGYALPDGRVGNTEFTRYWGYDNASQVSGNNAIVMQRSSSSATASSDNHYDNPMSGLELTYNRELIHNESWRGGLEGAFGYTYMHVHDSESQSASVTRVNDTYAYSQNNGVPIPPPGYTGRKSSAGPTVSSSPSSSTTDVQQDAASITGSRDFSADLFNFRVGPYVEIPLSKSIAFTLSGGFALVYVNSKFSFDETVAIAGVGSVEHHASGSGNGLLPGAYVAGNFSVALSDSWAFVAGAQFESVGQYTQTLSGKQATLDLSKSIFVTVGLTYSF
jgi:hypothetical protein